MNREKRNKKGKGRELDYSLREIQKSSSQSAVIRKLYQYNDIKKEKKTEVDKEILRRLRIQNKKLIEQLTKLKDDLKKAKLLKRQVSSQLNGLVELVSGKDTNVARKR